MENSRLVRVILFVGRPKIGIPLFLAVVILFGPFVYRQSRLAGLPDIGDPFDIEKFGTVEITDEENAFVEYNRASLPYAPGGVDEVIEQGWSTATPAIRKWLDDNRDALELLKTGSKKPKALIGQPKDQSYLTMIGVRKHRALSRRHVHDQ